MIATGTRGVKATANPKVLRKLLCAENLLFQRRLGISICNQLRLCGP